MLQQHSLKQKESKSGADFVDREKREYLALCDMDLNVEDSIQFTKFYGKILSISVVNSLLRRHS